MAGDDVRRSTGDEPAESPAKKDPFVDMIRDLPRLRSVDREQDLKPFVPPPPTLVRFGAVAQGCGGFLLTLLSIPMLLVALWFGYYLWGPGLFLVGGLALLAGTVGVWRGRLTALLVAMIVILALWLVAYFWSSFVPAVAALSPIANLGTIYSPAVMFTALALFMTLLLHVIGLFYWKRLKPIQRRGLIVWGAAIAVLVVLVVLLHFGEMRQRQNWMETQLKDWRSQAATESLVMGANADITLGYSFITVDESSDVRYDVREAELVAALDTGASPIRVGVSGDLLLEREHPRLFEDNKGTATPGGPATQAATEATTESPDATPALSESTVSINSTDRLDRQLAYEQQYMAKVVASGVPMLFSDSQYSPYLLTQADKDGKVPWEEWTQVHEDRIRHYAELYRPAYYEVITEPVSYAGFSGIAEPEDEAARLDAWVAHTEALIAALHEVSPETKVGVTIAIDRDFDEQYYGRVLDVDGLSFIGVRMYQPAAFDQLNEMLDRYGHPRDHGKELWITETWYGYCLAPQRSMKLDSEWLEATAAFAAQDQISAVIPSDFGCFLQKGGTLFANDVDLNGRSAVWERWRALVQQWAGS